MTAPDIRWADVEGPITGARPPWGDPGQPAAEAGYVVREYQLHGRTVAYEPAEGTKPGPDGRWHAVVMGEGDYRTRILVVRPEDPARFNGTVILNWQNVSAGAESGAPRSGEVYRGYAWVGVSAQEVGISGFPMGMSIRGSAGPNPLPLLDHDPQRYGNLRHPGDQGSFDMFTQAARAVGPLRSTVVDPLDGLAVRRVVAAGGSQSAMRLVAYINAVQPLNDASDAIDGFLLSVWEGRAPALTDGPISFGGLRTAIRSDTTVPVLVVNSEFETLGVHAVGTVDTEAIRVWEVAGTPHGVTRQTGAGRASSTGWVTNRLSYGPVYEAALRHIHRWVEDGVPAPAQPRIQVDFQRPPQIRRDALGNAIGGVRLPEMAVPTAEYRGMSFGTGRAPLFGACRPFSDDVLRDLYPTRDRYAACWNQAVDDLIGAGALLAEDAPAMRARLGEVRLPFN